MSNCLISITTYLSIFILLYSFLVRVPQEQKKCKNSASGGTDDNGAVGSSNPGQKEPTHTEKPLKSDAILSCPACMSTLCIDCQR